MCKFHSVFLSVDGRVFTCGHGRGGRLGHGNEKTLLVILNWIVHTITSQLCNFYNCYMCWYLQNNVFFFLITVCTLFLPTWNISQWVYTDTRCQRIISLQDKALLNFFFFQSSTIHCNYVLYLYNFLGRKHNNFVNTYLNRILRFLLVA